MTPLPFLTPSPGHTHAWFPLPIFLHARIRVAEALQGVSKEVTFEKPDFRMSEL